MKRKKETNNAKRVYHPNGKSENIANNYICDTW